MRCSLLLVGMVAMIATGGSGLATHAVGAVIDICLTGSDDGAILACTLAINSRQYRGHDLAWRYDRRAFELQRRGDNEHALADYDAAIQIDPQDITAYVARGDIYSLQGDKVPRGRTTKLP
jgi:tetratricopeptide (TPR) repeat protein